jgi:hypothetical protein
MGGTGRAPRRSKAQRRIDDVLARIPAAREQLLAAMAKFGREFELVRLAAAVASPDPDERNAVAALERDYEVLINWLDELASRGLSEALRLNTIDKAPGKPFERLREAGAISERSADTLVGLRNVRDGLQHAYPLERAAMLHDAVVRLLPELDRFVDRYERWLTTVGIRRG